MNKSLIIIKLIFEKIEILLILIKFIWKSLFNVLLANLKENIYITFLINMIIS